MHKSSGAKTWEVFSFEAFSCKVSCWNKGLIVFLHTFDSGVQFLCGMPPIIYHNVKNRNSFSPRLPGCDVESFGAIGGR